MPRRRPPGAGPALSAKFIALNLLLALPWVSTAAQQQQSPERAHGRSPSEGGSVHTILPPKINDTPSRKRLDTAATKRAFTHIQAKDERAVGTFSSAPAISAVGAQYGRDAADSGVLTPGERSIDDWTIEDFMLLATVDGHIHARNRYNGMEIWELDVGKPMLETIYNTKNESDPTDGWRNKPFIWIVEPKEDGALYILSPGPRPVLQSLGLTVKQLTDDLNPYASDDPPVVYTAKKESIMLVVDASTGRVTKSFSTDGYMSPGEPESCHTKTPEYFNGEQQHECKGFFNLGQTEYVVSIQDKNTGAHICTIKYSEWTSNNRDRDLQRQYRHTKDEMYLVSRYNGDVIAYDKKRSNFAKNYVFQQKLGVPVTRVFDVARKGDDNDPDPALVLLPQPPSLDSSQDEVTNVWLNTTDAGSWYALSEANYPAVTDGAPKASCYTYGNYLGEVDSYILPERRGLVGVHRLNYQQEPSHTWSAIAAPTGIDEKQVSDRPISVPPGIPRPPVETTHLTLDPPQPQPVPKESFSWTSVATASVTSLLCIALVLWTIQKQQGTSLKKWVSKFNTKLNRTRQLEATVPAPLKLSPASAVETAAEALAAEPVAELPIVEESKPIVEEVKQVTLDLEAPTPPELEKKKVTFAALPEDEEEDDLSLSRTTTIDADSLATGDSSAVEGAAQTSGTEDSFPDQGAAPATPKKKKTHRGKRGGQKGRNRRVKEGDEIDQIVDAAKHLNEPSAMHPDEMTAVNGDDVQDVSNIKRIGKLTIDFDRLLGNGSGGTFVFEGKWNDRDVAVKRMLPQYFGLAEQEVKLLQESDLHPNVIRYFDDEKDENFLYIAVEICQASLFDLYRDGRPGSDLTDTHLRLVTEINSNVSRALHQLAEGVHHLHSLRIIHRDIKPQNILIAYPQRNQKNGPRLVISDFGLCKTLPDNMSTLIGTTGNAGTVGWKAPELILQPKDVGYGSSTGHSRDSSASTDPVSQGVKRAVDIFSLGCVFYYVLTNGSHPFDDDEGWAQMREYNIKKNKASYERLSLGPDSEEPIRLISWMLSNRPEDRPTAAEVMNHPFFWSAEKRLTFLCDCSDHWEREIRDPPSPHLSILETYSEEVLDKKRNFLAKLDNSFIASLGKQRKYTGDKMLDLLRALRNKKNHYEDMEDSVKAKVGPLPDGYLQYWTSKFPKLLMSCFDCVVECGLQSEPRFKPYFPQANN
ncbi:bifunctional endoribonuclease/protein kinase ire1 [Paraconiothyrium brasiliense]|uniref:Bifunctional endoribonuclease/protein kinase ire1 n=1 Tax=Paraconiothyrium brasiliense TaxID=300254 RepID=A0ABR3QUF3_9PLEO